MLNGKNDIINDFTTRVTVKNFIYKCLNYYYYYYYCKTVFRSVSDLLSKSKYDVSYTCGRAHRSLLHIAAKFVLHQLDHICSYFESLGLFI